MSNKTKAFILMLASSILSGASAPIIKYALKDMPPFGFTFIRFLIPAFILLPFVFRQKISDHRGFAMLFFIATLPVINVFLFIIGISLTTATASQTIYAASPLLTAALAAILFGSRYTISKWVYIVMGFVGCLYTILAPIFLKGTIGSGNSTGNILIGIAAISYSLYLIFSQSAQKKYSPFLINTAFVYLATVVFFVLFLWELPTHHSWWVNLKPESWLALLYVALGNTFGGYLLTQYNIKYGGPLIASLTFYLIPIVSYTAAYFLLGEILTIHLVVGAVIILLAVFLETYAK